MKPVGVMANFNFQKILIALLLLISATAGCIAQSDSSIINRMKDRKKALNDSLGVVYRDTLSAVQPDTASVVQMDTVKETGKGKKQKPVLTTAEADSLARKKERAHKPWKAALMSATVPGLGQIYNKKYWKLPIVYAGLGGLGYAVYYTATEFVGFRNAYRLQIDGDTSTFGSYRGYSSEAQLKLGRDYYKRYLDISAVCMGIWYLLNIIDATVDAHLFHWNVSDDLSLEVMPSFRTYEGVGYSGVGLRLHVDRPRTQLVGDLY